MDGGTIMNQCAHNIDLLQWMLGGDVKEIFAMTENYNQCIIYRDGEVSGPQLLDSVDLLV